MWRKSDAMPNDNEKRVKPNEVFPILQPEGYMRVHRKSKTLKRKPSDDVQFTVRFKLRDLTKLHEVAARAGRSACKQALFFILEGLKSSKK